MGELITDLTGRFLSAWKQGHSRSDVAAYPSYFLGPIIVSGEGGGLSVIDGQQRLTSLSILLIWLLSCYLGNRSSAPASSVGVGGKSRPVE